MNVGDATALLRKDCYVVVYVTKVITDNVERLDESTASFFLKFVVGNYQFGESLVEFLLVSIITEQILEVQMQDIVFSERSCNNKMRNRLRLAMAQHIAEENA